MEQALVELVETSGWEAEVQQDTTMLPWPFCITYDGRPYKSQVIHAPDADLAALSIAQLVGRLNRIAQAGQYPPLFAATTGDCPL